MLNIYANHHHSLDLMLGQWRKPSAEGSPPGANIVRRHGPDVGVQINLPPSIRYLVSLALCQQLPLEIANVPPPWLCVGQHLFRSNSSQNDASPFQWSQFPNSYHICQSGSLSRKTWIESLETTTKLQRDTLWYLQRKGKLNFPQQNSKS